MNRVLLLLSATAFILININAGAQVGRVNQKSQNNKNKTTTRASTTRPSSSTGNTNNQGAARPNAQRPTQNQPQRPGRYGYAPRPPRQPGNNSSCSSCGVCSTLGCAATIAGMWAWQTQRINQSDVRPHIIYGEVMMDGAFDPINSTFLFMPRLRGAYGLFGGDLRFTHLDDGTDVYQTVDFQFLQINFLQTRYFDMRIGTGIKYEFISDRVFNEHLLGMDLHTPDFLYNGSVDVRAAFDYGNATRTRTEVNISGQYFPISSKYYIAGPMAGIVYQNYYGAIDFWFIQAGFRMRFQR